jgi:hypothetical protein
MPEEDRMFWLAIRQALLMFVDAIERRLGLPRTADLRKEVRLDKIADVVQR